MILGENPRGGGHGGDTRRSPCRAGVRHPESPRSADLPGAALPVVKTLSVCSPRRSRGSPAASDGTVHGSFRKLDRHGVLRAWRMIPVPLPLLWRQEEIVARFGRSARFSFASTTDERPDSMPHD